MHSIKDFFKKIWHGWTKVIHFIGNINATIILTLLMVLVFFPLKLVLIITKKIPIKTKSPKNVDSYWLKKDLTNKTSLSKQF